jgi:peptidoglycan/xylan/chitin deacetylase (PgdA/CDA1 family)
VIVFLILGIYIKIKFEKTKNKEAESLMFNQQISAMLDIYNEPLNASSTEENPPTATSENKTSPEVEARTNSVYLPILLYHYVEPLKKDDALRASLTISPEIFEQQLELINKSKFQTITMSQVASRVNGDFTKEKNIALTFDDGYRDFYEYVFPLLKKYQIKATVYVIYNAINAPDYLTEDMIKEMMNSGLVEIGSHALDHKMLTSLNKNEAKRQVTLSKTLLEKRFKAPVATIAYPYGSFNKAIAEYVEKAGYQAAVSVIAGEQQSEINRFFLARLRPVNNTNLIKKLADSF